ncbi:MAG: cytochrome o ubiquinol oxidase subunit III [Endozoicomonas sp. (ex Botrylloides leachii)]|nr:cytochrome o ubiquinol oxidase subunit III [Endozoicomonas sp. (ex Botrylloides leachii)]
MRADVINNESHNSGDITLLGFWIYILTDCVLFATLFATYAVISPGTAGGPSGKDIFDIQFVLVETLFLLTSSVTYGFSTLAMYARDTKKVMTWLAITFLLGACFVAMEVWEFHHLISEGYGPDRSGFLSAFFTLVGTHGLHVSLGLVWIATMIVHVGKNGLSEKNQTRLKCLGLFWHFLDIIWICVFSLVYLLGVVL